MSELTKSEILKSIKIRRVFGSSCRDVAPTDRECGIMAGYTDLKSACDAYMDSLACKGIAFVA